MSKFIELKNILKNLANEIKAAKIELKDYQREHGGDSGSHLFNVYKLKYEFRHKHIAYSQLRGRTYEEIEKSCSRAGEPNFELIKGIMAEYGTKTTEDVRACA